MKPWLRRWLGQTQTREGNNSSVLIKMNDLGFSYSHEMDFRTRANSIQIRWSRDNPPPPHPMIVTENIVGSPAVGTSKKLPQDLKKILNEKIALNLCISYNGKISSFLFLLINIRISDFKMA